MPAMPSGLGLRLPSLALGVSLLWLTWVPPAGAEPVCVPRLKWEWSGRLASESPLSPLIVAQLSDDDGDGLITTCDVPDVVFAEFRTESLIVLDGETGRELLRTRDPKVALFSSPAAGDIDGDGIAEIVALDNTNSRLVAFEHTGELKWVSARLSLSLFLASIGLADFDQDGAPEIYFGAAVFNADGSLRWIGGRGVGGGTTLPGRMHASHAIDLRPERPGLELLAGNTLYASDGTIIWYHPALPDGLTAVGDLDGDGEPEIVLVDHEALYILDIDGEPLAAPVPIVGSVPDGRLAQPILADIDADGRPEIIAVQNTQVEAIAWDGTTVTKKWLQPTRDISRLNGAAAADLGGDAGLEVVYHDENSWYVFDGPTGVPRFSAPFPSITVVETPVIVDLDHDGQPEILVSGSSTTTSMEPALDAVQAWDCDVPIATRGIWNQYGYHYENVAEDGSIPAVELPSWTGLNGWLSQGGPAQPTTPCGPTPPASAGSPASAASTAGPGLWRATRQRLRAPASDPALPR